MSTARIPCSACGGSKVHVLPIVWGTGLVNGHKCEECDGKGWSIPVDPEPETLQLSQRYWWVAYVLLLAGAVSAMWGACQALK